MKILVGIFFGTVSALIAHEIPQFGCAIGWFGCGLAMLVSNIIDEYRKSNPL